MAGRENFAGDDAALFLSPGLSVGVICAGTFNFNSIWTAGGLLPTVSKDQRFDHHLLTSQHKVVVCVAIVVSTETTNGTLLQEKHINIQQLFKNSTQ